MRHGTDRWPHPTDPSREAHLVLTQRYWRNPAVPLTGYARSLFRAEVAAVEDSTGAPDSLASAGGARDSLAAGTPDSLAAAGGAPADSASARSTAGAATATPGAGGPAATPDVLAWTELTLVDIGADARPDINQKPELAPDIEASEHDPSGFQR
ncbi:MAG TPA: hypothetical protein VLT84_04200 [Acidobacteriota bacterium]|nr:hypothetical protein [Acidobacteriota bacterium]